MAFQRPTNRKVANPVPATAHCIAVPTQAAGHATGLRVSVAAIFTTRVGSTATRLTARAALGSASMHCPGFNTDVGNGASMPEAQRRSWEGGLAITK